MRSLHLICIMALALCAGTAYCQEANKEIFDKELALTQQLISKAETVNGVWRDTRKLVTQAQEAADVNNYQDALKLLEQAQFQAQAGYEQASRQDKLEPLIPYYLK